ncbi:MAG: hypothetical protein IJP98_03290 [Clostridia bacterium]|nr:hypothetical protein [Clostridia bacterium]
MEIVETKRRMPQWAANLLIWCCPALTMGLFAVCISGFLAKRNVILTIVCFLLFGLIVTRLIFLFRSHRTVGGKIWRCVVWVILVLVLCFVYCYGVLLLAIGKHHNTTEENAQSKFEEAVERILPKALSEPLDLGSPNSVVLHEYREYLIIFETKADTLLCQYDAAAYEAAKTALESRYHFRTKPLETGYTENPEKQYIDPYTDIGNDHFRFLRPNDEDQQSWGFYKRSLIVVTNDETHEIGYILFDDIDLDVAEDLSAFLMKDCGWEYIRN